MSEAVHNPTVWPCVFYDDAEQARLFLTEVFGFTEALTVRGEDETSIVHAELRWPEGGGVMFGTADATRHPELPKPAGVHWLYVVTDDPDAVHKRAVVAGATVLIEPHEEDYGSRSVTISDPQGHVWTFGTYRGA